MSKVKREFDIIIWGASGFTGGLVAEYIYKNYDIKDLKWAIGGRNKQKLANLRDSILDKNIPIVLANSLNEKSLIEMVKRTNVICSTVGPYAKYGSLLVKSCVRNKTHYCDIAGETQWIRKIIDLYHEEATSNHVKIVNSCGFDSVPSDIGVYFINQKLSKKNLNIKMRVTGTKGGISGGTYASLNNVIFEASKNKKIKENLINPYGLNPYEEQYGPDKKDLMTIKYDKKINKWIAPFVMAGINTKIVRRTNAIFNYRYGKKFKYDEAILTGDGLKGIVKGILISIPLIFVSAKPGSIIKKLINFFAPKPGEGPSLDKRNKGYFTLLFYVFDGNETFLYKVTGDKDPGYGSTSKMIAECAICLAKDSLNKICGVLTPASAMESNILKRLEMNAGLKFSEIKQMT